MSQIFALPKVVSLQSDGTPYASAKLYFYRAGTLTLQQVYTTLALSVAHAQPVQADSAGLFAAIYLNPSASYDYRVQLKTSADVLIYDQDNIPRSAVADVLLALTQAVIGGILYPITAAETAVSVTPTNYYIVNDYTGMIIPDRYVTNAVPGTTDMTSAIQQALNVAAQGPGKVQLLGKTYLTGNVDWPANGLSLSGAASCFSADTSGTPRTVLKAKAATTILLDLIQTGTAVDRQGNHISDLEIDGNSIAPVGIDACLNNVIERVSVKGTTTAGIRLSNFTNGMILRNCKLNSNSGWGLKAEGASTTPYELIQCRASSNTLGGMWLEAGVGVRAVGCIVESNGGPALKINRPVTHSGGFLDWHFEKCWFEDNASTSPFFTLFISSDVAGFDNYPARIVFTRCRFNTGSTTRKHMNLGLCSWVRFNDCNFDASTQSDALTFSTQTTYAALINSATSPLFTGLSASQIDNAIAQGTRCYSSDIDITRAVQGGIGFSNSWVNYGAPYGDVEYWFDTDGNVRLRGAMKSGTINTTAFTLPVGYRPSATIEFPVDSNGAYGTCRISSAGVVTPLVGSNAIFSFNNVCFPTK